MTQIFTKRPELMPIGESTQEHKKWQEEEAALVEKDRATIGRKGGLFRGCFKLTRRRQVAVIRDNEDGVDRCPRCTWELEDGCCQSCGYPESDDSADMSDSDDHARWNDDFYDMDEATVEEMIGAIGESHMEGHVPNFGFSEHEDMSDDGSSEGTAPQIRRRDRHGAAQPNRLQVDPHERSTYDSFLDDRDGESEGEEGSSLDGFIMNDVEDGPHSVATSTGSLHWETDEGTESEGAQAHNSDNDQDNQDENGLNGTTFTIGQDDPEDESDDGPILRSRRQARRRSVASDQSSGSDGSRGSGVSQALNALRVRRGWNGSRASANPRRTISHWNSDARRERSTSGPLEIESESDSPVPAQHTRRRRRAVPVRLSSDDDSGVEASSGTAAVGRDSPRAMSGWISTRHADSRPATRTNNALSPTAIESTPIRSVERRLAVPGAFPQQRSARPRPSLNANDIQHASSAPTRANQGEDGILRNTSMRRSPANASPSNGLQQRRGTRRRSPLPLQSHPRSPTPSHSHSPTAMEMFEQGRRDRQARKIERRAERRRLKAEREQRGRPPSGLSLSPGSSNQ